MPGEMVRDERPQDAEQAFKVTTYIPALDSVHSELRNRFTDMAVDVLREMQFFTPRYLLSDQPDAQCSDINKLCKFYEMNETNVSSELAEFRSVFRKLNKVICVDDLLFDKRRSKHLNRKSESEVYVYRDDCVNGEEQDDDDDYQYVKL